MKSLFFAPTEHPFYCETQELHKLTREIYPDWKAFLEIYDQADPDFFLLFRFDLVRDPETKALRLYLFFVLQADGDFLPVIVRNITKPDLPHVSTWLYNKWLHLNSLWADIQKLEPPLTTKE